MEQFRSSSYKIESFSVLKPIFLSSYHHIQTLFIIVIICFKWLGLRRLREHKFKHSFQDTLNPRFSCGSDVETTEHFILYCLQLEILHLTQALTPRPLKMLKMLTLILSNQLKDLMMSSFLKNKSVTNWPQTSK